MEALEEKHSASDLSLEKKHPDGVEVTDDAVMAKEVEEFEERLQNDEAAEEEYLVQEAYEVAIKVRCAFPPLASVLMLLYRQVLSTKDDPELQSVTFRTVFLGLGFSAFGA